MYGEDHPPARVKEIDHVTADYRVFIEKAPFFALATSGPDGLDCSPRGDPAGFVRVHDEKTLMIPDRGGTIRVNGRAQICTDPELCRSFTMEGKTPRCVLVVTVERCYFQCPKAIV